MSGREREGNGVESAYACISIYIFTLYSRREETDSNWERDSD